MKIVLLGLCVFALCAGATIAEPPAQPEQPLLPQASGEAPPPGGADAGGPPASAADLPPPPPEEKEVLDRISKMRATQPKNEEDEQRLRKEFLAALAEHRTKFPNSPRAPMILQSSTQLMAASGQLEDAVALVQQFLKGHSGLQETLFGTALLMDLYSGSQQLPKAVEVVQNFLKTHPNSPQEDALTYKLADYLSTMGQTDQAVAALDSYQKAHPDHPKLAMLSLRKADIMAHGGKPKEAVAELLSVRANPKLTDEDKALCTYLLGLAYVAQSREQAGTQATDTRALALAECEKLMAASRKDAAANAPYGAMAFSVAADAYLADGEKDKAIERYKELTTLFKDKPEGAFAQQALKDTALIGTDAPEISGTAIDGSKVSLKALAGKVVVVDFWASWNPGCLEDLPNMRRLQKEMQGRPFVMLGVSMERPGKLEDLKKFVAANEMTWPELYEEKGYGSPIVKAYAVTQLPATFVIDGSGKFVRVGLHGAHLKDVVNDAANKIEAKGSK